MYEALDLWRDRIFTGVILFHHLVVRPECAELFLLPNDVWTTEFKKS